MKNLSLILILVLTAGLLFGCSAPEAPADIAATTLPVYQFTAMLVEGTELTVTRLFTESVSCLHDYSLNVSQVKAIEGASVVVISGVGMEAFMEDLLADKAVIDSSASVPLLESCHDHGHEGHVHEADSHIWLSPVNAAIMANNICQGLCQAYPQYTEQFQTNLVILQEKLDTLQAYGKAQLKELSCRQIITFHDGFSYLAACYGLEILAAVEEESGSEASAQELIELIEIIRSHSLTAVFTEENGADSAAKIISAETGAQIYTLNMAMAGEDYFAAMYQNIDALREALK